MIKKGCIISCVILCTLISYADAVCNLQAAYTITETASSGTLIFNGTKTLEDTVTFRVKNPNATKDPNGFMNNINNALLLTNYNTAFKLENTKQLDLEEFWISYEVDITTITLTVTCGGNTVDVFISVTPVNEFAPVFINSPYNITLPESTQVGTVVYKLKPNVQDKDVGGVQNFYFQIHPYSLPDYDGSEFFGIPASSTGNITLKKALDFDTTAKNTHFLNLSVADGVIADAKTTQTTLQIRIEDVDDQVPYFEYPNCPAPCPAPVFESVTRLAYTGPLEITPPLKGKDDDTLGTYLLYSIKIGNKNNLFTMDPSTGAITQSTSVAAANLPDTEFRLLIEVRKNLQNIDLSSVAVLNVKVWERWQNDNNYQGNESTCDNDKKHQGNESTSDNDKEYQGSESTCHHSSGQNDVSAYKTAVIILAVALAIVTTVLFVVIVMYMFLRRTKQHTDTELHSNYQDLSPHHLRNGGVYS